MEREMNQIILQKITDALTAPLPEHTLGEFAGVKSGFALAGFAVKSGYNLLWV